MGSERRTVGGVSAALGQHLEPRVFLNEFLSGSLTLEQLLTDLTPWVIGPDDMLVDQIVGLVFADARGVDTPELRRQLCALVVGEETPPRWAHYGNRWGKWQDKLSAAQAALDGMRHCFR